MISTFYNTKLVRLTLRMLHFFKSHQRSFIFLFSFLAILECKSQYWSDTVYSTIGSGVNGVTFTNEKYGFACYSGAIIASRDSGRTWDIKYNPGASQSYDFRAIAAINKDTFVAIGQQIINQSFDGGNTWKETKTQPVYLNTIYLSKTGDALCGGVGGVIYRSRDYGKTWKKDINPYVYNVNKIKCNEKGFCIALCDAGFILHKNIKDTVWQPPYNVVSFYGVFRDVEIINDSTLYVLDDETSSPYNQVLHISRDTGRTWVKKFLTYQGKGINRKFYMKFISKDSGLFYGINFEIHRIFNIDSPLVEKEKIFHAQNFGTLYMFDLYKGFGIWGSGSALVVSGMFTNKIKVNKRTSIPFISQAEPTIYPNPVEHFLNIDLADLNLSNSTVEMYDISGSRIRSYFPEGRNMQLDIHELRPGNYILVIKDGQGVMITKKIITKL